MAMWMVEYTYDDQTELRDATRPAHRTYLADLVQAGDMVAYGRYDDDREPGAMLVYVGDTAEEVEALIAADPFVSAGLVPHYRVRKWAGVWAGSSA